MPCGSIQNRAGVIQDRHAGESSTTDGCLRHGFALAPRWSGAGHAALIDPDLPAAPSLGPLTANEDGERTSNFTKPMALRGLCIAFGLTFTAPSGGRSPPGTTGGGAHSVN